MIKRSAGVLASSVVLVAGLAALSPLAAAAVAEPRRIPDQPGFYQRILVKPDERDASDARLLAEPNDKAAVKQASIPLFTVLYVYDCKPTDCTQWLEAGAPPDSTQWIEVGAKADGTTDGWIKATHAQDWRSMLAMQFAPRGQRSRAAMFQDLFDLEKLVTANDGAKQARELSSRIETGKADPRVVAAEPKEAVNPHNAFYLLPILRWKTAEFADGTPTHLLEIAGVNHKRVPPPLTPKPKVGVVFVLETSHSMGPYLERTKQTILDCYRTIEKDGSADRVSIGIIGYRTNGERDKRLEYTTKVFQQLNARPVPTEQQLRDMLGQVKGANAESPGWDEDAFAGLYTAMQESQADWEPYFHRILVLVADSGAIRGNSRLAKHRIDLDNIVEIANRMKIAVFPVYLLTPPGDRLGNRASARFQWHTLGGKTGDPTRDKYIEIRAGSVDLFGQALDSFANTLAASIKQLASDQPIERPTTQESLQGGDSAEADMGQSLLNELFRGQLEYLGTAKGITAPTFFRAWVSDHDLANPRFPALQVRVFLTRNQLSGLGSSLNSILEEAKRASLSPENFFYDLQSLSATMSGDPNRQGAVGSFSDIQRSNLLPSYLKALPYKSKVLRLTQDEWLGWGLSGQQEFIDELEYKYRSYQDIEQDKSSWVDLGAPDRGDQVYPVPLDLLP